MEGSLFTQTDILVAFVTQKFTNIPLNSIMFFFSVKLKPSKSCNSKTVHINEEKTRRGLISLLQKSVITYSLDL